jgi:predicted HicB family RNase H-like nuclease
MKFDAESYSISIRKEEDDDGEIFYVGRVAEFPNISAFTETFEEAHELVIDSIQTLKKIAVEKDVAFPAPYPTLSDEFSGRITLRLPKSLHAKISKIAYQEDISVNQYLVTAVAYYAGENNGVSRVVTEAVNLIGQVVSNAICNAVGTWKATTFLVNDVFTSPTFSNPKIIAGTQVNFLPAPQINATVWQQST